MIFKKRKTGEPGIIKDGWRMICPEISIKEEGEKEKQPNPTEKKDTFKSVYDMDKRAVE